MHLVNTPVKIVSLSSPYYTSLPTDEIATETITFSRILSKVPFYCHIIAKEVSFSKMSKRNDDIAFPLLSLPAYIPLLIFDEISGQKHCGWDHCAAVCKWHDPKHGWFDHMVSRLQFPIDPLICASFLRSAQRPSKAPFRSCRYKLLRTSTTST